MATAKKTYTFVILFMSGLSES